LPQSTVIPAPAGSPALKRFDHLIGGILIDAGRLKLEDAERILHLQREQGLLFGDAALKLGLLTEADIQFALSRQFNYPYLVRGESKVSEDLIAAYARAGPQLEALRALRSQLMLRWFDNDPTRKALAIVSGERREGRSYIAANLAVVFSQLGQHTLLIDADMRNPSQHNLFGIDNSGGLSEALSGRGGPVTIRHISGLPELWVLPSGASPPNPLELLARPRFPQLLAELGQKFDVILLDSPAATDYADAQTLAVRAGAALIVARKNATRMWQVRGVSDSVAQGNATIVGTVLNDF
jgi:chain length determinant protein tyrosine kinase EpsG